ncbi:MAG: hypothetical protein O2877_01725 [bacterium]|nr:hypothetical protein [bacterium]
MSKTPNYDAKVKKILDELTPGEKTCAALGTKWNMDEEEIAMYRKFNVPPSKFAPITRMKLIKGSFCAFDMWYNKHADTGEPLVSTTHPATGVKVLPDAEWFNRDFVELGVDVDIARSIHDQLYELSRVVPLAAHYNYVLPENSLAFISFGDQDSYFVLACKSKRTYYAMNGDNIEDSAEIVLSENIRNSYNVVHSKRIFNCRFVRESFDCMNSDFIFDCRNTEFCFGATNQRNKKYLWFNEQLSEEEWEQRFADVDLSSWKVREEYLKKFQDLVADSVWPENFNLNTENCTGEYIQDSTNVKESYYINSGCRDLTSCTFAFGLQSHDCAYMAAPIGSSDCYYGIGANECSGAKFALSIVSRCIDVEFCSSCFDCENLFGCVGLRKKKFCIFNKQYTEEEYWKKLDEIKSSMLERGEYGDFPSMKHSTQHWSGSGAKLVYDATEEECLKLGAAEFESSSMGAEGPEIDRASIRKMDGIPDTADDTLLGSPYFDDQFGRRYGYLKPELALYTKLKIAPPRSHPTRRIYELYDEMNKAVYKEDTCKKCSKNLTVALNKKYTERNIYCMTCYLEFLEQRG